MTAADAFLIAWCGAVVGAGIRDLLARRERRDWIAAARRVAARAQRRGDRARGAMPDTTPEGTLRGAVALRDDFAVQVARLAGGVPLSIEQRAALMRLVVAGAPRVKVLVEDGALHRIATLPSPGAVE